MDSNTGYQFIPLGKKISIRDKLDLPQTLYSISLDSSVFSERYKVVVKTRFFGDNRDIYSAKNSAIIQNSR